MMGKAPVQGKWSMSTEVTWRSPWFVAGMSRKNSRTPNRMILLAHAAAGSTSPVVLSCGFWEVVKHWMSQNLGGGRPEGTPSRICRTKLVCDTPARGACAKYVCDSGEVYTALETHPRDGKPFSQSSRRPWDLWEGWPAHVAISTAAQI